MLTLLSADSHRKIFPRPPWPGGAVLMNDSQVANPDWTMDYTAPLLR